MEKGWTDLSNSYNLRHKDGLYQGILYLYRVNLIRDFRFKYNNTYNFVNFEKAERRKDLKKNFFSNNTINAKKTRKSITYLPIYLLIKPGYSLLNLAEFLLIPGEQ